MQRAVDLVTAQTGPGRHAAAGPADLERGPARSRRWPRSSSDVYRRIRGSAHHAGPPGPATAATCRPTPTRRRSASVLFALMPGYALQRILTGGPEPEVFKAGFAPCWPRHDGTAAWIARRPATVARRIWPRGRSREQHHWRGARLAVGDADRRLRAPGRPGRAPPRRLLRAGRPRRSRRHGTVLDVGAGAGRRQPPAAPLITRLTAVDTNAAMLEAFATGPRAAGLAAHTVRGRWPDVADRDRRGRRRGLPPRVLQRARPRRVRPRADRPRPPPGRGRADRAPPAASRSIHCGTQLHGLDRPTGPTADDAVAVLRRGGYPGRNRAQPAAAPPGVRGRSTSSSRSPAAGCACPGAGRRAGRRPWPTSASTRSTRVDLAAPDDALVTLHWECGNSG